MVITIKSDRLWKKLWNIFYYCNVENNWHILTERKTAQMHSLWFCSLLYELGSTEKLSELSLGVKRQWDSRRCVRDYSVTPRLTLRPHLSWPCCNLSLAEIVIKFLFASSPSLLHFSSITSPLSSLFRSLCLSGSYTSGTQRWQSSY